MGISGGGITALQLAPDRPGTVRRLVLCAAWIGSRLIAHGPLRLLLLAAFGLSRSRPRTPGEATLVEADQACRFKEQALGISNDRDQD